MFDRADVLKLWLVMFGFRNPLFNENGQAEECFYQDFVNVCFANGRVCFLIGHVLCSGGRVCLLLVVFDFWADVFDFWLVMFYFRSLFWNRHVQAEVRCHASYHNV